MKMRAILPLLIVAVVSFSLSFPVRAQPAAAQAEASKLPDRIIRPMRAIDPMTLRAEGVTLKLWGIKPAQTHETPLELKALDLMDSLIQEQQVNCKIVSGAMPELVARCATQDNQDLALELLGGGYAVVDRYQTYNSVFASAYEKAQEGARLKDAGVWGYVREDGGSSMPGWLRPHIDVLLPVSLIFGPLLGFMIIALVLRSWMKRTAEAHQSEMEQARRKETMLAARERQVLVSTLEGELIENKNKIEAFLVIYGDMLRTLKDTAETPKYQQVGDIVQKHPSFSKIVFEANVNKLSLLDIKTAGVVSKLYSAMPKEQEYINLDQTVPLDTAVKLVEKVLKDAENLLEPINGTLSALQAAAPTQAGQS